MDKYFPYQFDSKHNDEICYDAYIFLFFSPSDNGQLVSATYLDFLENNFGLVVSEGVFTGKVAVQTRVQQTLWFYRGGLSHTHQMHPIFIGIRACSLHATNLSLK